MRAHVILFVGLFYLFAMHSAAASSDGIACVQDRLSRLGFDPGPVDGVSGGKTLSATRAYKEARGATELPDFSAAHAVIWCEHLGAQIAAISGKPDFPKGYEPKVLFESQECVIERVVYPSEGLRIVGHIERPVGQGPYPVIVENHGSQSTPGKKFDPLVPSIEPYQRRCREGVRRGKFLIFYPEGRGYAGSDGRHLKTYPPRNVMTYLSARARDTNAGVEWLFKNRKDVIPECVVIRGASHGGVVSILAASKRSYRGVVAQATGPTMSAKIGVREISEALVKIGVPVLLQHAKNDGVVPVSVSRQLANAAQRRQMSNIEYREYDGPSEIDGHHMFVEKYDAIWRIHSDKLLFDAIRPCS